MCCVVCDELAVLSEVLGEMWCNDPLFPIQHGAVPWELGFAHVEEAVER